MSPNISFSKHVYKIKRKGKNNIYYFFVYNNTGNRIYRIIGKRWTAIIDTYVFFDVCKVNKYKNKVADRLKLRNNYFPLSIRRNDDKTDPYMIIVVDYNTHNVDEFISKEKYNFILVTVNTRHSFSNFGKAFEHVYNIPEDIVLKEQDFEDPRAYNPSISEEVN